jgi:hypothetical protein
MLSSNLQRKRKFLNSSRAAKDSVCRVKLILQSKDWPRCYSLNQFSALRQFNFDLLSDLVYSAKICRNRFPRLPCYKARIFPTSQQVVVKYFESQDESDFFKELRYYQLMYSSPHIPILLSCQKEPRLTVIVTEYCGVPLDEYVRNNPARSFNDHLTIAKYLLFGIQNFLDNGIMLQSLNPGHVLVNMKRESSPVTFIGFETCENFYITSTCKKWKSLFNHFWAPDFWLSDSSDFCSNLETKQDSANLIHHQNKWGTKFFSTELNQNYNNGYTVQDICYSAGALIFFELTDGLLLENVPEKLLGTVERKEVLAPTFLENFYKLPNWAQKILPNMLRMDFNRRWTVEKILNSSFCPIIKNSQTVLSDNLL